VQLEVHAFHVVGAPTEKVFDFAVASESLPCILKGFGPIPGITSIEMLDGAALATGAKRRVRMSDGSDIFEEVTALDRPRRHSYRWLNAPAPPFSLLVRGAEADWIFTASAQGTRIEWTYRFELTSPLAAPLAAVVMMPFKRWMRRGLERIEPHVSG
jgi:Polyketide cyclase / dehydrase and lipid transport